MKEETKKKLKVAGVAVLGAAATGVVIYYSYKKISQKAFEDGLIKGAEIGRDAVLNIIKSCDPESKLISGLRNVGVKVSLLWKKIKLLN